MGSTAPARHASSSGRFRTLAWAAALAASASAAPVGDLQFPTPPDLAPVKADELRTLAAEFRPGCGEMRALGWTSKRPLADLARLAGAMDEQTDYVNVRQATHVDGSAADGSRRLYTAERKDGAPVLFLWLAGKNQVVLQTCSGAPPAKPDEGFNSCAVGVAPGGVGVLGVCPPRSSM